MRSLTYSPKPGRPAARAILHLAEHAPARSNVWFTTAQLARAIGADTGKLHTQLLTATRHQMVRYRKVGRGRALEWQQGLLGDAPAPRAPAAAALYPPGHFLQPVLAWWPNWRPYVLPAERGVAP